MKLTEEERRLLGHKTCWMEGLFLAEDLRGNTYVVFEMHTIESLVSYTVEPL